VQDFPTGDQKRPNPEGLSRGWDGSPQRKLGATCLRTVSGASGQIVESTPFKAGALLSGSDYGRGFGSGLPTNHKGLDSLQGHPTRLAGDSMSHWPCALIVGRLN